jgi:hypothetical protein
MSEGNRHDSVKAEGASGSPRLDSTNPVTTLLGATSFDDEVAEQDSRHPES